MDLSEAQEPLAGSSKWLNMLCFLLEQHTHEAAFPSWSWWAPMPFARMSHRQSQSLGLSKWGRGRVLHSWCSSTEKWLSAWLLQLLCCSGSLVVVAGSSCPIVLHRWPWLWDARQVGLQLQLLVLPLLFMIKWIWGPKQCFNSCNLLNLRPGSGGFSGVSPHPPHCVCLSDGKDTTCQLMTYLIVWLSTSVIKPVTVKIIF